jgi:hypothetical protein
MVVVACSNAVRPAVQDFRGTMRTAYDGRALAEEEDVFFKATFVNHRHHLILSISYHAMTINIGI